MNLLYFREGEDLVQPSFDLACRHAEDRPVEIHVFQARQLRMKSGPHLKERPDRPRMSM